MPVSAEVPPAIGDFSARPSQARSRSTDSAARIASRAAEREGKGPTALSTSSLASAVVVTRCGSGASARRTQGRCCGVRERRFAGGLSSAMSRSSRTRASISVAVSITRTPTAVSSIRAIVGRFSAAVKYERTRRRRLTAEPTYRTCSVRERKR